jgi:hypothetical protein
MTVPAKLNHLFSQVSSTYEHQQKSVRPGPALDRDSQRLPEMVVDRTRIPADHASPSQ